ncbi:MAG: hypothetical protein ACLRX7_05745 [Acutalibacteraceae bacterium]
MQQIIQIEQNNRNRSNRLAVTGGQQVQGQPAPADSQAGQQEQEQPIDRFPWAEQNGALEQPVSRFGSSRQQVRGNYWQILGQRGNGTGATDYTDYTG